MSKEPKTAEQVERKLPDCGASHFGVCHREDGCAIEYTVCREQIRQQVIEEIARFLHGEISKERLAENIGINFYELDELLRGWQQFKRGE